ncbi:MAG: tetratricopeptide repeat protein [bacterium]
MVLRVKGWPTVQLVVTTCAAAACAHNATPQLIARADEAGLRGRHRRACELYYAAVNRADLRGEARFTTRQALIRCAQRLGHVGALAARARAVLSRYPGDPLAHYTLALTELIAARGTTAAALRHLRAARKSAPGEAEYPFREGQLLYTTGRLADAARALQAAIRMRPKWARPRIALARAWATLGKPTRVRQVLMNLPDCNPTSRDVTRASAVMAVLARQADPLPPEARPLFNKAMELLERELTAAAAVVLRRASRRFPQVATFALLSGLAQIRLSNYGTALSMLQRAARLNPADFAPPLHLAEVLSSLGRTGDALPHYRRAKNLNPVSRRAHTGLGTTLLKLRRTEEALPVLRRAAALSGRSSTALQTLAEALMASNKLLEATRILRDAVRWERRSTRAKLALARLLLRRYRAARSEQNAERLFQEARRLLRSVVRLAPDDEQARRLLRSLSGSDAAPRPKSK